MRIGVLTGGGDCPGLNAVIRAVVKVSSMKYGWEVLGIEGGLNGLKTPPSVRSLTAQSVRGILPLGGTILGTSSGENPLAKRKPLHAGDEGGDPERDVIENVRRFDLSALVIVGGDGTLRVGHQLSKQGIPVIGIPKTIDNDIPETDSTFGFHTAVNTATEALDKLHTTAESHQRVMVIELMGRYAGWIALEAGLAGGADVILIPEIPFDIEKVCKKILSRYEKGAGFSIVVVAEGAKPVGGEMSVLRRSEDGYVLRLGGVGDKVGSEIAERTMADVRVTVLGHIQRGGSPTPFDRNLGTRFGYAACALIEQQAFGRMVCLKGGEIQSVPLEEATRGLKLIPADSGRVQCAEALGISFGR